MQQHRLPIYFSAITVVLFAASFMPVKKLKQSMKVGKIESVLFTPNTAEGWSIYSYYLNQDVPDSVEFELILKHSSNINWASEHWIGTINDSNYIPQAEQNLTYYLLPYNNWDVRIATNGQCFLNIMNGSLPPGDSVIIPVKVRYKNN